MQNHGIQGCFKTGFSYLFATCGGAGTRPFQLKSQSKTKNVDKNSCRHSRKNQWSANVENDSNPRSGLEKMPSAPAIQMCSDVPVGLAPNRRAARKSSNDLESERSVGVSPSKSKNDKSSSRESRSGKWSANVEEEPNHKSDLRASSSFVDDHPTLKTVGSANSFKRICLIIQSSSDAGTIV